MTGTASKFGIIRDGVTVRRIGDEIVTLSGGQVHALSGDAAILWRSIEDGAQPSLSADAARAAQASLAERGLIEVPGLSRRSLLARGGLVAAAAGVTSLALPTVAAAASSGSGGSSESGTEHVDIDYINVEGAQLGARNIGSSSGGTAGEQDSWAQRFTVGHDGVCTRIEVSVATRLAGSSDLLVQLRSVAPNGGPLAESLATAVIPQSRISTSSSTVSASITPLSVTAGEQLFIVLSISEPTTTADHWYSNSADSFFYAYKSMDGGVTFGRLAQNGNFRFATYLTY